MQHFRLLQLWISASSFGVLRHLNLSGSDCTCKGRQSGFVEEPNSYRYARGGYLWVTGLGCCYYEITCSTSLNSDMHICKRLKQQELKYPVLNHSVTRVYHVNDCFQILVSFFFFFTSIIPCRTFLLSQVGKVTEPAGAALPSPTNVSSHCTIYLLRFHFEVTLGSQQVKVQ